MLVYVTHGYMTAAICVGAGFAIAPEPGSDPDMRAYLFWYANPGGMDHFNETSVLPGLPWDRCVNVEMPERTDLVITLEDEQNTPIIVHFKGPRLNRERGARDLQAVLRRKLRQEELQVNQEKLKAFTMGLHPRLGTNPPPA